jgi:hypothetical protein
VLHIDAVLVRVASILSALCFARARNRERRPISALRQRPTRGARWLAALLLLLLGCGALAPRVRADDLTDFEKARTLYEKRNYAGAAAAFMDMVGTDPPRISERLLLLESRKYLGASLLFLGRAEEARGQFRLLLLQQPDNTIDPLAFPKDVVALFERIKNEVQSELKQTREAEARAREEELRKAARAAETERQNLRHLLALAGEAQTERSNSRWVASIPFGVGQFQNGHKNLGVALAVLEGIAAVTSIATYLGHQQVADDRPSRDDLGETRRIESLWRTTNIASFSAFLALAVAGVIDAQVRFVPARVTARRRPLPPELEQWATERKLSFSGLGLRF